LISSKGKRQRSTAPVKQDSCSQLLHLGKIMWRKIQSDHPTNDLFSTIWHYIFTYAMFSCIHIIVIAIISQNVIYIWPWNRPLLTSDWQEHADTWVLSSVNTSAAPGSSILFVVAKMPCKVPTTLCKNATDSKLTRDIITAAPLTTC